MNPRHSYAYLDGLRGWAALMVAYGHFVLAMHPAMLGSGDEHAHFAGAGELGRTGLIVLYNPLLAVDIFFVLSGFVLATAVNTRPAPLLELIVRRWLRLALPILATTALIWPLVNLHLFSPETAGPLAMSDWLLLFYNWSGWPVYPAMTLWRLSQSLWTVFVSGYPTVGMPWYNPALWTIKMEFWGSIGLFVGYWLLPAAWTRRGVGLFVALVAVDVTCQVQLLGSFVFGVALYEVRRLVVGGRVAVPPNTQTTFALLVLAVGAFLGGMPYDIGPGFYRNLYNIGAPWVGSVTMFSHRVAALCIITGVLLFPALQRLLLGRLSQWLGRVSFALYLVHTPILCSLGAFLLLRLEPLLGYNTASLVALALYLMTALTGAGLGARWIDEPSIRIAKQLGAAVLPVLRRAAGQGRRRLESEAPPLV